MNNLPARNSLSAKLFSDRLGLHQFAHLRAVAQGISVEGAAARYLGIEHGAQAQRAHAATVDQVKAVARRRGHQGWRLVSLEIQREATTILPSLQEWVEAEGMEDWRESEQLEAYQARFATELDAGTRRRQARNARLIERRLRVLRELEIAAAQRARPEDDLAGWFAPRLAERLRRLGLLTLQDLQERLALGGRWWTALRGLGPVKAARIEQHLQLLLGDVAVPAIVNTPVGHWPALRAGSALDRLDGQRGLNRAPAGALVSLDADTDRAAVHRWIAARAGSVATARAYERELERYRLWCAQERGKALSDGTVEDCRAYMDFIANVPASWMSRRGVARGAPGWAPFKGPLTLASQRQAITIVHSAHAWLVAAGYLVRNPWDLVSRRLGDDPSRALPDPTTRAFTPEAWQALIDQAQADAASKRPKAAAAAARSEWLLRFSEATGLRAAELLASTCGHLERQPQGWVLKVHGKGRKSRVVPVPASALAATRRYFSARGLELDEAPASTPLVGALTEGGEAPSYSALAQTFKGLVRRASRRLGVEDGLAMGRASAHWLRHTHGTRAIERGVPIDVLQENLGHADPRTSAAYARAQMRRRAEAMERAFAAELS